MGGYVGQMYAQMYPEKIRGFISIDSAPLKREYFTDIELRLLKKMTPLYRHFPWKLLLRSGCEGVTISTSKITRSQQFKGGKNSPKYALFATDNNDMSFWGAQNTFLAWYRNLEDVTREITEIQNALDAGITSYTLQYSVKCKHNLFRTIEE